MLEQPRTLSYYDIDALRTVGWQTDDGFASLPPDFYAAIEQRWFEQRAARRLEAWSRAGVDRHIMFSIVWRPEGYFVLGTLFEGEDEFVDGLGGTVGEAAEVLVEMLEAEGVVFGDDGGLESDSVPSDEEASDA